MMSTGTASIISTKKSFAFKNLKIAYKFLAVFVVLLVGLAAIAFAYGALLNAQKNNTTLNQQANKFGELIDQIEKNMLQVQSNERDFLLQDALAYVEDHQKSLNATYQNIDQLTNSKIGERNIDRIKQLQNLIKFYQDSFDKVVEVKTSLGLDENSGLRGAMRAAVHAVEDKVNQHGELPLLNSMLMMRRHEKDYLARQKDKYIERMAHEQQRFDQLLDQSSLPLGEKKRDHCQYEKLPQVFC